MVYVSGGNELLDPLAILARLGVKTGSKLADLGCGGAGHFIIPAASMVGPNTIAIAVDIQKQVLHAVASKARIEGINNVKTVWTNLESIGATNIEEKSLDFVLLINTLYQSPKPKNIMIEGVRLLKEDGKMLVIDWDKSPSPLGPAQDARISEEEIKKIAGDINLNQIDSFSPGAYHYGLIYQQA